MLNIYGHFMSMPTNIVRLCVSFLNFPHEYIHVELQKSEHQTPEYLKMNPAGRVPAIDDNGFLLSQSSAICKYICALSGPCDFYPEELHEQAIVNQWDDYAGKHILPAVGRIFFNKVVAGMVGAEKDEAAIRVGEKMLVRDLPVFDAVLKKGAYVTGEKMTLADITLLAALEPAEMIGLDLSIYPALQKWRKGMMARNFYQRVHTHFGAELSAG